jgi:hypothetical protein
VAFGRDQNFKKDLGKLALQRSFLVLVLVEQRVADRGRYCETCDLSANDAQNVVHQESMMLFPDAEYVT